MTVPGLGLLPRLVFANGACAEVGAEAQAAGMTRVLLVTDPGVRAAGLTDKALVSLYEAGLTVEIFDQVAPDPPESVVLAAVSKGAAADIDGVVEVGGGSAMDVAKLVASLVAKPQELSGLYGVGRVQKERLPLVLVPTTSGSGSEATGISVVTTPAGEKQGIVSPVLLPDVAVLDPELAVGLPAAITAATGVDAIVHSIEAYTSRSRKTPLTDALAAKAFVLLAGALERACANGSDLAARGEMMWGATLAGMAISNALVGAVHALAYPLGTQFHVPHGLSNALMLPHVLKRNLPSAKRQYAELIRLLPLPGTPSSDEEAATAFITLLEGMLGEVGLPRRLSEIGVASQHLGALADEAMGQTRLLDNNPRALTREDAIAAYEAAL